MDVISFAVEMLNRSCLCMSPATLPTAMSSIIDRRCGLNFCWICMQPIDKHTNCKPWNPEGAYTGKGGMTKSELGRFIDSASLYENHQTA